MALARRCRRHGQDHLDRQRCRLRSRRRDERLRACGYGKHDVGYRKILATARHVSRGASAAPTVGEGAARRPRRRRRLPHPTSARLPPEDLPRPSQRRRPITLTTRSAERIEGCGTPAGERAAATSRSRRPRPLPRRDQRGGREASGSINVVNQVGVDAYAQEVLPGEIYPSWPKQTLRAFAVAARSIALATDVGGEGYGLSADTRTQVYEGAMARRRGAPTPPTVQATRDEVLTYRGRVIQAFYHSSSRWPDGVALPRRAQGALAEGVRDPYQLAPLHRWRVRFSQAEVNTMLGGYVDEQGAPDRRPQARVTPRIVPRQDRLRPRLGADPRGRAGCRARPATTAGRSS